MLIPCVPRAVSPSLSARDHVIHRLTHRSRRRPSQRAQKSLEEFAAESCHLLPSLPMSLEVLNALWEERAKAGYQVNKDRGTFQGSTIESFERQGTVLGGWTGRQRAFAAGPGGSPRRSFWNVNRGETGWIDAEDQTASGATNGWHRDNFWDKSRANGRVIMYFMSGDALPSLFVRDDHQTLEITVPCGAALFCSRAFLEAIEHSHGANGRSLSLVTEVEWGAGVLPVAATADEIAAACAAQPPLPLLKLMGEWKPKEWFLASPRDYVRFTPGSTAKMALTQLIGQPKQPGKHRQGVKRAREERALMAPADIEALASQRGTAISMLGKDAEGKVANLGYDEFTGKVVAQVRRSQRGKDEDGVMRDLGYNDDGKSVAAVQRSQRGKDEDGVVRDLGVDEVTGKSVAASQKASKKGNVIASEFPQHIEYLTKLRRDDPSFNGYAVLSRKLGIPRIDIKNFFGNSRKTKSAIAKENAKRRAKK